jgi:hypothetical protein
VAVLAVARVAVGVQPPVVTGRMAVEQAYNDNVQQHIGAKREGAFITTLGGQLGWKDLRRTLLPREFDFNVQGHVYDSLSEFDYVELGPEGIYPLLWGTEWYAGYTFSPRRLLFDEDGDQPFYTEHIFTTGLRGKYLSRKQLRTQLLFEVEWDNFRAPNAGRTAFIPGLLWDARYRFALPLGLPIDWTPRVGVEYAEREARRDNYNRHVVSVEPGFDVRFPGGVMLRFRYERDWRDYTVGSAREAGAHGHNNNDFGRHDDIEEYRGWLAIPLPVEGLALGLRYRYRDGVFDAPNRKQPDGSRGVHEVFDVHEIGLEISYSHSLLP